MTYSHTSRRLPTEAKLVLERAGYTVAHGSHGLAVFDGEWHQALTIIGGTVTNTEVVTLLKAKGFNEFGHKVGANDKA